MRATIALCGLLLALVATTVAARESNRCARFEWKETDAFNDGSRHVYYEITNRCSWPIYLKVRTNRGG